MYLDNFADLRPVQEQRFAYAGNALGREIVYERSQAQVRADIERLNPAVRGPRAR